MAKLNQQNLIKWNLYVLHMQISKSREILKNLGQPNMLI